MGSLMFWGLRPCRISPGLGEQEKDPPGAQVHLLPVHLWFPPELARSSARAAGVSPVGLAGLVLSAGISAFPRGSPEILQAGWGEAFLGKSSKQAAFPGGSWAFLTLCWVLGERFGNVPWVGEVVSPPQVPIPALSCSPRSLPEPRG